MTTLITAGLHRDVFHRGFVHVVWKDDPEKCLGLLVPSDWAFERLKSETEKAIRAFAKELESAIIESPET
jgi:hypothetical protein